MDELEKYREGSSTTGMSVRSVNGRATVLFAGINLTKALEDILIRLKKLEMGGRREEARP